MCSTSIKSINKKIKNSFYLFFVYFSNWLLNRAIFRRIIQRFIKNIINYRANFVNLKFQQQNSNNFSFIESIVSRSNRFQSQSSTTNFNRRFTFFFDTSFSNFFSLLISIFKRNITLTLNASILWTSFVLIFNIEFVDDIQSIDNNQFLNFNN